MAQDWTGAIERAERHAPFLARQLRRFPDIAELLAQGSADGALAAARAAGGGVADVGTALRRERAALSLALAVGELAGAFPLDRVMSELSDMADRALGTAINAAIARRVPDAQPRGFTALALGKHGGRELNYSSDIDPILLFDPDALPRRPRDELGAAAQRYARDIVQLLSAVTAEGFVFRVDLRLRPASEVTPPALSFDAALSHYESSALAWERAAFIRARSAAGDVARGAAFLRHIDSFIWRRSLDFGAIDEVRRLTRRIREQQGGPAEPQPGYNVKLGRGGIREIEFFAQTHQLIHGGRNRALRVADTRAALRVLAEAGVVPAAQAEQLCASYAALRTAEHRLQMVEDRQTHTLPDEEALDAVARLDGQANGAAFLAHLRRLCAPVAAAYDALLAQGERSAVYPGPSFADDPHGLAARIIGWSGDQYRVLRSEAAIQAFEAVRPQLAAALLAAPDPVRAVAQLETLLTRLPSIINLFRLLEARPSLFEQLTRILSLAPLLAEQLSRRPTLLDPLIDRSALDLPGTVDDLVGRMRRAARDGSYEARLDAIRIVTGEVRFALGVQLIEAAHDPLAIGAALGRLAEAGLREAQAAAGETFAAAHGLVPGGELVVLALGRVGGGLLTHASDLDLVYLFTGDFDRESDGGSRPLGATLYFNRLASRLGAALSVPTAEGALYQVDTRLRPQGAKGPLACSVDSFRRYQMEEAWTWEHMALTRARPVTGSAAAQRLVSQVIAKVLDRPRDPAKLLADVLSMRADIARHKPPAGPLDVKNLRGGLVDLEFVVHLLQLRERRFVAPDLGVAVEELAGAALLRPEMKQAHDVLNRVLIAARLLSPDLARPHPAAAERLAAACGADGYDTLCQDTAHARAVVAREWARIIEQEMEIT